MTDQPIPQVPRQTRPEPTQQDQQAIPAPPQEGGPHVLVYVPAQGYSWQPLPQVASQMQEQQQGQGQGTTKPAGASTSGAQGTGGTMGTQGTSATGATGTTGAKERE